MTSQEKIRDIRLSSQGLYPAEFSTAEEILERMGAIQAQDFAMAKWALGVRMAGSSIAKIEESYNRGEILRTHLMRPTWHFVSARDIQWILELTAPRIRAAMRSRDRELELSEALFSKSNNIIERLVSGGKSATREDFAIEFKNAGINTGGNRLSHLLVHAELEGILCSGPIRDKKLTYASFASRAVGRKFLTREESLAELAKRYFQSRYPATQYDFAWWSGLQQKDARTGIESIRGDFYTETIGSLEYIFPDTFPSGDPVGKSVHLLPAYDEYLISYRDRSASLPQGKADVTISANGIFYPVVVVDGLVKGVWKQSVQKGVARIDTTLFDKPEMPLREEIEKKGYELGIFLDKKTEVRFGPE